MGFAEKDVRSSSWKIRKDTCILLTQKQRSHRSDFGMKEQLDARMPTTKQTLLFIIGSDIVLGLLNLLSGLLFYSLILDNGYQLYWAFLLIPLLAIFQLIKIYIIYKCGVSTILFSYNIILFFLCFIPLSDAIIHDIKITYPLSAVIYFILTAYLIIEPIYYYRKSRQIK